MTGISFALSTAPRTRGRYALHTFTSPELRHFGGHDLNSWEGESSDSYVPARSWGLFATPWATACQVPLCMEFSRQERWNGLPCPSAGVFLDQGSNLCLLHWQGDYHWTTGEVHQCLYLVSKLLA